MDRDICEIINFDISAAETSGDLSVSSATTGDESSGHNSGGSRVNDKPDAVSTLKKKLKKVRVWYFWFHD